MPNPLINLRSVFAPVAPAVIVAPSGGNVTWNNLSHETVTGSNIAQDGAGANGYANSDQTISSSGSGYFQFSGNATNDVIDTQVFLLPSSGAPYTQPVIGSVPTTYAVRLSFTFNPGGLYKTGGTYVQDVTTTSNDVFTVGFDGSSRAQVKQNGTTIWTDSATTAAGSYMLYIIQANNGNNPRINSVTFH